MPRSPDDLVRAILPPIGDEYNPQRLSDAETKALEAAFQDGFGPVGAIDNSTDDSGLCIPAQEPAIRSAKSRKGGLEIEFLPIRRRYVRNQPPRELPQGLLSHPFVTDDRSTYCPDEQDDDEFWDWNDDEPPPSFYFPLGFAIRPLRLYFQNQFDRFCAAEIPGYVAEDREIAAQLAGRRMYEKPWYEFNALQFIDFIEANLSGLESGQTDKRARLSCLMVSSFSGRLGRLVEQYYWRFRFERAAQTGIMIHSSATNGGMARARLPKPQLAEWRAAALEVWRSSPTLSKTAVSEVVKKKLRVSQTAKHIARFIKRP